MIKLFYVLLISVGLFAQEDSSSLTRQKLEVQQLKKELNNFYNQKEKEYIDRKKELEDILGKIQKEKKDIQDLHDKNLSILQDIKQTVQSKTATIYNGMKAKVAAAIFDQMINEGKIEDVFDIILRLKEKKVTELMKFLSVSNAARLTQMLKDYNQNKDVKE